MDLATICNKIQSYSHILAQHNYKMQDGGGIKPWSHRYTNGLNHVDVRGSEWTAYAGDIEMMTGPDPKTLASFLTEDYKNGCGL